MMNVNRRSVSEIAFAGDIDLNSASEFRNVLKELTGVPGVVTLSFADLAEIDTAGLQVLVAFGVRRGRQGYSIPDCPENIRRRIRVSGLDKWIPV